MPFYDRTPLIEGAIRTVSGTVLEAMVSASLCVLVVLLHVRTSLVVAGTLPLAALSSFLIMALLRRSGLVDIPANAMSLAGIAISIGVLVDSSVVMTENVMHRLSERHGTEPVRGDVPDVVLPACLAVGRPIVFSVAIMVLSFLPVFALQGIEGKMFRPLAYTKTFALVSVAVLAVTLVPALCTLFIRGRLRSELENPLVRVVIEVYRPVLSYLMDRPAVLAAILGLTFLLGFAPLGNRAIFLGTLFVAMVSTAVCSASRGGAVAGPAFLVLAALLIEPRVTPLGREFMTPLDEGMVMDMPITVPRASVSESVDDLKARDMVLCRFPEVDMVVGKAGRAETPTDPAPMDMIETMVSFRPREFWPRRKLHPADAAAQCGGVLDALIARQAVAAPADEPARRSLVDQAVTVALERFDAMSREYAYHRNQAMVARIGRAVAHFGTPHRRRPGARGRSLAATRGGAQLRFARPRRAALHAAGPRGASGPSDDHRSGRGRASRDRGARPRAVSRGRGCRHDAPPSAIGGRHHHGASVAAVPLLEPQPTIDAIQDELSREFSLRLLLWEVDRDELTRFGGELDNAVPMPGWTNVWTTPIQNRVDMLTTGVNTPIGIRVLGRNLDDVIRGSEEVARVVKAIPGAVDVVADPLRGKPYIEVRLDRERAARLGVLADEVNELIETALAGKVVATTIEGRERHPVVVRFPRRGVKTKSRCGTCS